MNITYYIDHLVKNHQKAFLDKLVKLLEMGKNENEVIMEKLRDNGSKPNVMRIFVGDIGSF